MSTTASSPGAPTGLVCLGVVRRGEVVGADVRGRLAQALRGLAGVCRAAVVTGDPAELAALGREGLLPRSWPATPQRDDLVVVVEAVGREPGLDALARVEVLLPLAEGGPPGCANALFRGSVAVVGSSEGALREVTTLVHHFGGGISRAIRTPTGDLGDAMGGAATLGALATLAGDGETAVVVLAGTRPAPAVAEEVIDRARAMGARVVAALLGFAPAVRHPDVVYAMTLEDAARAAAELSGARMVSNHPTLRVTIPRFTRAQRWLRGLYTSAALAWETVTVLGPALRPTSNLGAGSEAFGALGDPSHLVMDFGDPAVGGGHPRRALAARVEAIRSVANDPAARVLLLDVPLGEGAHERPAEVLGAAIREARAQVAAQGGTLVVVASVTGTEGDAQVLSRQIGLLVSAGVEVCSSNAAAARRARAVVLGEWL